MVAVWSLADCTHSVLRAASAPLGRHVDSSFGPPGPFHRSHIGDILFCESMDASFVLSGVLTLNQTQVVRKRRSVVVSVHDSDSEDDDIDYTFTIGRQGTRHAEVGWVTGFGSEPGLIFVSRPSLALSRPSFISLSPLSPFSLAPLSPSFISLSPLFRFSLSAPSAQDPAPHQAQPQHTGF